MELWMSVTHAGDVVGEPLFPDYGRFLFSNWLVRDGKLLITCNLLINAPSKSRGVNAILILDNACCTQRGEREKRAYTHCAKGNPLKWPCIARNLIWKRQMQKVAFTRLGLHIEPFLKCQVRWGNFAEFCQGNWLTNLLFGIDPPIRWEPGGGCMLCVGDSSK